MLINKLDNLIEQVIDNKITKDTLLAEYRKESSNLLDLIETMANNEVSLSGYRAVMKVKNTLQTLLLNETKTE